MKESDIRDQKVFEEYIKLVKKDVESIFDSKQYEFVSCPACMSEDTHNEFRKNGFQYVTCKNCGTLYCNPRPTVEQLNDFYSKSVSGSFFTEHFFKPFAEARREKIFRPRAEEVFMKFPEYNKKKIGDIGAGYGIFLEELKKKWNKAELVAIEPSEDMIKICKEKNLSVIPKIFEDIEVCEQEQFDMLFSFELFEHLSNPKAFLDKCYSILRTGGYLVMTTLNGQGFDIQILWENHKNVNPPVQLNIYSIKLLLEKCGFEVVEVKTPGRIDWDIVEQAKKDGISIGRLWEQVVNLDNKVKSELQKWISESKLSSHMQVIARKR